jgi:transcriptional regulator with XRE-family HTH domain
MTKYRLAQYRGKQADMLSALGECVRKHRLSLQLSQNDLAIRAGIHRTYLSDIESGKRNLTLLILFQLADALGTNAGDFISAMYSAASGADRGP